MEEDVSEEEIRSFTNPSELSTTSSKLTLSRLVRGLGTALCIVVIVLSWVTMAEKLQDMGNTYKKPFFQSFFIHSWYSIMYIFWKLWLVFPGGFSCNKVGEGTLTNFKKLALTSALFVCLKYVSGALWYLSLNRTSVSANTAIFQSSSAVVFILSVPLLGERVSVLKVCSVALTICGVSLVSFFSGNGESSSCTNSSTVSIRAELSSTAEVQITPLGYVFVTASMVLYAVFETLFKKLATEPDDPAPVQNSVRVLGYIGVHTLLWTWPLLVVLHFTGLERFEFPSMKVFKLLLLNTFLDLVFNSALFVCITLSSPLLATVGSVLVIPASVMGDWFIKHYLLTWQAFIGTALIIVGFFCLVISELFETLYLHSERPKKAPLSNIIQSTVMIWRRRKMTGTAQVSKRSRVKQKLKKTLGYII